MTAAALRAPFSPRRDLAIPLLVVLGLWAVGAWYYADHTFRGGAIATPDQAIAQAKRSACVTEQPELARLPGWRANLNVDKWYVHLTVRSWFWQPPDGDVQVTMDARTGRIIACSVGAE